MIIELNYEASGRWAENNFIAQQLVNAGARCLRIREIEPDYEAPEGCSKDAKSFAVQIEWLKSFESFREVLDEACWFSKQDCAAVWLPVEDKGYLIGPRADKWGEFNMDYFELP